MWYVTDFEPVSMISLKNSTATSTGGKSLLLPTPFALKMALLDVIVRVEGVRRGEQMWTALCSADVALQGPAQIAVNNTFTKILKPLKGRPSLDPDTGLVRPMNKTIAFREYVQWHGRLRLAIQPHEVPAGQWSRWLTMITHIGKRGGFIQALGEPDLQSGLDESFVHLSQAVGLEFSLDGTLQLMDDCSPDLTFDHVNVYSSKNMRLGVDRILRHIVLPYRPVRSSRGYTLYQRF